MTLDPDLARARLRDARLCLLLTRSLCRADPLSVLEDALEAGVDVVQVREPDLLDRELLEWVHDVRESCAARRVPVIVNDRPDVAVLAGAEGIHVGQDDLPPRAVREIAGPDLIVGLSTHDLPQVTEAATEPVDYIGVGPVFDTATKSLPGRGASWVSDLLRHAQRPVFGVGGIRPDNVAELRATGLRRIAVCAAVCGADDPGAVVTVLREAL